MCKLILTVHAISGCDTTYSIFGMGKVKVFKLFKTNSTLKNKTAVFGTNCKKDKITESGELLVSSLYNKSSKNLSLNN